VIERWRAWLELRRRRSEAATRCSFCGESLRGRGIPFGDERYPETFCSSGCQDVWEIVKGIRR